MKPQDLLPCSLEPLDLILSHLNPVHTLTPNVLRSILIADNLELAHAEAAISFRDNSPGLP
jgi:hypothetical protein